MTQITEKTPAIAMAAILLAGLTGCANNSTTRAVSGAESAGDSNSDSNGGESQQVSEPMATSGAYLAGNFKSYKVSKSSDGSISVEAPAGSIANVKGQPLLSVPVAFIVAPKKTLPGKYSEYTKVVASAAVKTLSFADGSFSAKISAAAGTVLFIQISSSLQSVRVSDIGGRRFVSVAFDGDNLSLFTPLVPESAASDLAKWLPPNFGLTSQASIFQKRIAVGSSAGLLLDDAGSIWAWGNNLISNGSAAPLGIMPIDETGMSLPTKMTHNIQVYNGTSNQTAAFVDISAGDQFACAVEAGGNVFCWGNNSAGQLGASILPPGSGFGTSRPQPVTGPLGVVQVSAGIAHACAVTKTGDLWCWGRNTHGETGGSLPSPGAGAGGVAAAPHIVAKPANLTGSEMSAFKFLQVAAGRNFTCVLGSDQHIYCFGAADEGVRGDGSTSGGNPAPTSPVQVAVLSGPNSTAVGQFVKVAAGAHHVCGIDVEGIAFCWGSSDWDKTGRSSGLFPNYVGTPVAETFNTNGRKAVDLALTYNQTCVLFDDGGTRCIGANTRNLLGCGADFDPTATTATPVAVTVLIPSGLPDGYEMLSTADRAMTSITGAMSNEAYDMGFAATSAVGRIATWGWTPLAPFPGSSGVGSGNATGGLGAQTLWLGGLYGKGGN